jgi:hypothetical protein
MRLLLCYNHAGIGVSEKYRVYCRWRGGRLFCRAAASFNSALHLTAIPLALHSGR